MKLALIGALTLISCISHASLKPCTSTQIESISDAMIDRVSGDISDAKYDKLFQSIASSQFQCEVAK